jgi:hypothetical protein
MRRRYLIWTSNFLAIAVLGFGVWLLIGCMPGMPNYRLFSGLVALTGLGWNHYRGCKLAGNISDSDIAGRIDHLMVVHYLIIFCAFVLVDFHR